MNKLLVSIMILSLVEATAAGTEAGPPLARPRQQAGIWYPPKVNTASDNVLLTASSVTVFEIQDDTGLAYIVCLEPTAQTAVKMPNGVTYTSIVNILPEPTTIAVLGLAGLLFHRPRIVRSVA